MNEKTNLKPPTPPRPKPRVVDYYTRRAAEEARRFQQALTKDNIVSFLKTLIWVIPLTLLIWVYAEQQQQIPASNVQAAIEVHCADPSRTVTLLSPPEKQILCDLWGPRSNIDRVRDSLTVANPLTIEIDNSTPLGEVDVQTLPKIENNARFRDEGITVEKADPGFLRVRVDELATKEIPVEAPQGLLSLQSVNFTPATVKITGPKQVLDSGHLHAIADIAGLPILSSPGQHDPVTVALSLLPADSSDQVSLSTKTVQATLTVKEADVTANVTNLPIMLLAPTEVLDSYRIKWDPPIYPSIKVVGPPDKIDEITGDQAHPIAALEIRSIDDLKNPKPKKLLILDLPPGVRLADGQDPQVSFVATPR